MATPIPSSLTLSSATFAKLSPYPYLLANLQPADGTTPPSRTNGRQPAQARPPNVNLSSLTHAHGSAVVRMGDTTVICGVRGETLLTSAIPNYRVADKYSTANVDELGDYDLLVPNIELATGCAPNFLPGVPPTTLAQTLSTRVYSLLHKSKLIDVEGLRIFEGNCAAKDLVRRDLSEDEDEVEMQEGETDDDTELEKSSGIKAYWVLYIDVLFISFDGNPFDAAWAAILSALKDTKLPRAYWDADREMVFCTMKTPLPLNLRGFPVACTAAVFTAKEKQKKGGGQYWILVDPDRLEESLCDETVTMVVDRQGWDTKILGISKNGGIVVGPVVMKEMAKVADRKSVV